MAETPEEHRTRMVAYRAARRRREAAELLRLAATMATYAAGQLANGLSPEEAQRAAWDVAGELAQLAHRLRQRTGMSVADRRLIAAALIADGVPRSEAARRLGVSERTVRCDLRRRPAD